VQASSWAARGSISPLNLSVPTLVALSLPLTSFQVDRRHSIITERFSILDLPLTTSSSKLTFSSSYFHFFIPSTPSQASLPV
jgi:hypothetical protein